MYYATFTQLTERYAERDLRLITDPDAQALDAGRAEQALADAAAEIDAWLDRRYVLPLVSIDGEPIAAPVVLVRCACDIAIYRLQTLRPADDIKDARQRYEDVVKLLKAIGCGDVSLPGAKLRADVADNPASQSAGMPQFGQPPSLFGRRNR
ncbi:phage protein Gp36 family protein [Serratia marcescens]|uniref:phage protein Gp36 family protein n=1 Tax=Serratia marcescens TaxID=615 RepID=UPI0007450D53|nr:phage protein Gp36 family protein [Serratia marcescens]CVF20798.1 Mu-like prophage protein gp36 [Serratia marcescens]